jgi:hypothetical protein
MDSSFRRQGSDDTQQPGGFLAGSLQIFGSILNWLAGLISLTEEELRDAGVYLGDQRYR